MRVSEGVLEQEVVDLGPGSRARRATGEAEEVLFVVSGHGVLCLNGERHAIEPDAGVNLGPGQEYELHNSASDPMRTVSVRIRGAGLESDPDPAGAAAAAAAAERIVVRRLADQEARAA